jgi:RNA polymerase subunit RPABC4/transcription elongation factor Spt4
MGLKQCDKCTETVDEAKAFCPACGNAFVEEQTRKEVSVFDTMDSTVQLGQTMYNQMLSDMGLNISKAAEKPEKRIEVIAPIETAPAAKTAPPAPPESAAASSKVVWIVLAVLGLLILLPVAVVAAVILARAVLARF